MLAHDKLFVHQPLQVLLLMAAFNPISTQPIFVFALGLFELHGVCVGPPLKDIQVPLAGIPSPVVPTALCGIYSSIKIYILEKAPDLILYRIQV